MNQENAAGLHRGHRVQASSLETKLKTTDRRMNTDNQSFGCFQVLILWVLEFWLLRSSRLFSVPSARLSVPSVSKIRFTFVSVRVHSRFNPSVFGLQALFYLCGLRVQLLN